MQEEALRQDMETGMSVEDLFLGVQESYEEAKTRSIEENKGFAKTEYFKMDKVGTYRLRILPCAPNEDGSIDRKSYEHPIHQMLLEIAKPSSGTKVQYMYVTAPRATDAGYSVDLIDTYRKLAIEAAKEKNDEKLAEKIGGGTFAGGLKYGYGHAMYVLDLNERAKGLQMLTLSHSQYKDLDERKFKLWQKKLTKNPAHPCPISSVTHGYPVEIEKKKNGAKTEYVFNIDNESDVADLSRDELAALLNAPRIPQIVCRYSRYILGATIEYLKQCDCKYDLKVMDCEEIKEVIKTLQSEIPKEDTGSFSFDQRTKDAKANEPLNGGITLDLLLDRYDELQDQKLGDKTEEGQELRGLIRAFIEQEGLAIRITRSTPNALLLDMVENAVEFKGEGEIKEPTIPEAPEEEPETPDVTRERRRR